jgi:hypothetical protein
MHALGGLRVRNGALRVLRPVAAIREKPSGTPRASTRPQACRSSSVGGVHRFRGGPDRAEGGCRETEGVSPATWSASASACGFDGFANISPAGEAPFVGKAGALRGFHGLDAAHVGSFEEKALAVGLVDDAEAGAVGIEARATGGEGLLRHAEEGGDAGNLRVGDAHVPGPAAAVAAALAEIAWRGSFFAHQPRLPKVRRK